MKTIKRFILLILLTVIGGVAFEMLVLNSMKVQWKSLGRPPETPIEIIQPAYIKTDSGNIYMEACNSTCWEKVDTIPQELGSYDKSSRCGEIPSLDDYLDAKVYCRSSPVESILKIYAIGKDGIVYYGHASNDEGTSMLAAFSPFFGALIGFILGVIIILCGLFSDWLNWLAQRAIQKEKGNKT
jgi:hypothetical protein